MRRLSGVLLLIAAACGGSSTGPGDGGGGPSPVSSLEVESGNDQSAEPTEAMPDSIVVQAVDDAGNPVEGKLVNFEVPAGDSAGTFVADALQTNEEGRAFNELTAGTLAWTARVDAGEDSAYTARVVASRDGRPDEVGTVTFAVQPGPLDELTLPAPLPEQRLELRIGDPVAVLDMAMWAGLDEWENPIPGSMIENRAVTWTYDAADQSVGGPSGEGWDAGPVPPLHEMGWKGSDAIVIDTTVTDPEIPSADSAWAIGHIAFTTEGISTPVNIAVLVAMCYEEDENVDPQRGVVIYRPIDWTANCPAVEKQFESTYG